MTGSPGVLHVSKAVDIDATAAGRVIGAALAPLEQGVWLDPNEETRVEALQGQMAMLAAHAIAQCGMVLLVTGRDDIVAGASIWLYSDRSPIPGDYHERLATIAGDRIAWFRAFDATLQSHHPTYKRPFAHLAMMGVDIRFRHCGAGTAMMDYALARLPMPSYLEAASEDLAMRFYPKFGYQRRPTFRLPHGGPTFWPMWRPAD